MFPSNHQNKHDGIDQVGETDVKCGQDLDLSCSDSALVEMCLGRRDLNRESRERLLEGGRGRIFFL